ncbi:MAG: hypothetical protein JWO21_1682 [Solirubrobacterales bacterium]|nr:hypothetical protein [Solirubrobacterales bacterium]
MRARRGCYARPPPCLHRPLQLGALEVRAHLPNTSRRAVVARTAGAIAAPALAVALGACGAGGGSQSPQALLNDTFASRRAVASGRIDLSLALSTRRSGGNRSRGGAFALRLAGPFQSLGPARLPRFALKLSLRAAGLTPSGPTLRAGATSTGEKLFIELAGTPFLAPASTLSALQRGYAEAGRGTSGSAGGSSFATLGLDPGMWLARPRIAGSARITGVETTHVIADVNVPRLLADAQRLSGAVAGLGLGSSRSGPRPLSPALASALASSVRSSRANVYTGARDHLLRRLSLRVSAVAAPGTRAALGGLQRATFTIRINLTALNRAQAILAPSNPQPLARLIVELKRLGFAG